MLRQVKKDLMIKRDMIESQPNTHKAFHVGHMRNTLHLVLFTEIV